MYLNTEQYRVELMQFRKSVHKFIGTHEVSSAGARLLVLHRGSEVEGV
jgi:hypothetical protein